MKDNGKMIKPMDSGRSLIKMELCMKVNGRIIKRKGKALSVILMVINI